MRPKRDLPPARSGKSGVVSAARLIAERTAAEQEAFSRKVTAERILLLDEQNLGQEREETLEEIALGRASEAFASRTEEERSAVQHQAEERLLSLVLRSSDVATGCSELLRQSVVTSWSAYEVLAEDLFAALLNTEPGLIVRLQRNERTRRIFQLKGISFETLQRFNFDLSCRLGEYLAECGSLQSATRIAEVFDTLFPGSSDLNRILSSRELRILNLRRNLIVHRRGLVDSEYLRSSGETCELGVRLPVSAKYVSGCVRFLFKPASELLRAAQAEIGSPTGATSAFTGAAGTPPGMGSAVDKPEAE